MNASIVRTLVVKDLMLYFRNRYFALITILGTAIYILLYLALPNSVDETFAVAVYAPSLPDNLSQFLGNNQMKIASMESEDALREAVISLDYMAGLVLTPDVLAGILSGAQTQVTVYFVSDAPPEMVDALTTVLRFAFNDWHYALRGESLALDLQPEMVGVDMLGQQIPFRNRLLPLLAVMMLMIEVMGLGSLIAEETTAGTLRALLITPVTVPILFIAKTLMGVLLAFIPALAMMTLTGNMAHEPLLIITTLLLGAVVATGLAFLIASASEGMMTVIAWGMLTIIIMMLPSYGVVFPGTTSDWVRLIPSYYLFDTVHQVVNFGASWSAVLPNLLILSGMGIVILLMGVAVMQRRLARA